MKFRVYYDDGSTFDGETLEDAVNAPAVGVQVIAIEEPDNPRGFGIVTGRDAYLWKAGRFWACDLAGMWDYLYFHPGIKVLLFGRTIATESYSAIMARALTEGINDHQ